MHPLSSHLAAATMPTPEKFGEMVGTVIVLASLILGIIKCALIMRRPTTHKLCVTALLVLLVGWLIGAAARVPVILTDGWQSPYAMLPKWIGLLLIEVALILGIIGLAVYDRNRFRQGRAQAVWSIVLGSLPMILVLASGVNAAIREAKNQSPSSTKSPIAAKPITNKEFNFSITPSQQWVDFKPTTENKIACLSLRRANPEAYLMVIAEHLNGALDLDQLREIAKSNIASVATVLQQSEEMADLDGITFARVHTKAKLEKSGIILEYEHWLATRMGFSWQFVLWSNAGDKAQLTREAQALMATFRVLDRSLDSASNGTAKDVARPGYGYRTKIEDTGWGIWKDSNANALFDFRAIRPHLAMIVLPLRFDSEPPDMPALTRGLLSSLDLDKTPESDFDVKPWTPGHNQADHDGSEKNDISNITYQESLAGQELQIERDVDGNRFHYILRIARGKDCAYLLGGWAAVGKGDLDIVRRGLDAITFEPPQGTAPDLTPAQHKAFGIILNEAAVSLMSRELYDQAVDWFLKGFKQANDPTVLGNAGEALERVQKPVAGRDMLAPFMDRFPNHLYLGWHYARLQALSGDAEAGCATFLNLIDHGLKDEEKLLSWLKLLGESENYPPALRCAEAWVAKHPSANSRRWQAQTLAARGDNAKAIVLLEQLRVDYPKDPNVPLDLGRCYNDAGEHAKAAEVAEKILLDGKEDARALMILGWSQMGRKWYRDAKATFERAGRKSPEDADVRNAIRSASAALGQGDNSDIKQAIEPVAIPPEVRSALAANPSLPDFGAGYPAAWLLRATGYHFEKGKPLRHTDHRRVKVLTADGAKEFSSVETLFDPLTERVFMNRLDVKDAAGKTVAQASLSDAYVCDLDNGTASHDKVLHMQVAGVQPGTTVEWEVTTEDRGPADSVRFNRHLFANLMPVAGEAVFVTGEVSALHAESAQGEGLKQIHTNRLAAWIAPPQAATPNEFAAVWAERRCPMLWLGGEEKSWEKVGANYLKTISDRLAADKSVTQLATSLVAGKSSEHDKIAAIARYVQKEIGYKEIEFGVRARRPNTSADTLRLRYGDCKDTALLTHQLLGAAGITSHLALVNTNWTVQPALPDLDQFNHMVVMVPALGKNWLLDATDKTLALADFPADKLWHAHALVLDPAGPRLIPPPPPPAAASSQITSRRTVTAEGHDWRVEESLVLSGYHAAWIREAFTGCSATEQRDKAQALLGREGAAQVREFRFANADDPGAPACLELSYAVRDGVKRDNGRDSGTLPALWERNFLGSQFVKERKTAFQLIYPLHFTSEVTVKLPAPAETTTTHSLTRHAQSEFGAWSLKPESRGNELLVHFDFLAKPGIHPAARYESFHEDRHEALQAWDNSLAWPAK